MELKYRNIGLMLFITALGLFTSCKKFIEIEAPRNSLVPGAVFESDELATSAMLGIYQQMAVTGYASGDASSISSTCGLAADEFLGYSATLLPFSQNLLVPENTTLRSTWSTIYARIYNANAILEGLETQNGISPPLGVQLRGEALFTRAFNYFYLAGLFGDVPLHLTTDYKVNARAVRSPIKEVYAQVIRDLKQAELLIAEQYVTMERVRPNRAAVQALLSRSYLYMGDWENAERYATMVIGRTADYSLVSLDEVFLKNSREAIWQLMPTAGSNTPAGGLLILTTVPASISLRPTMVNSSFEPNDLRKSSWVRSLVVQGTTYYYPFKYKVRSSATVTEYTMVFRLAELYLIRAEARAYLQNLAGAIDDLDKLRKRAGIALVKDTNPGINKVDLLTMIQKERLVELFSEWGDRWFDLKRNGRSSEVLSQVKVGWKTTNVLFPIPKIEIDNNTNIIQNEGY